MSRILKYRKKKMSGSQEGVGFLASENEQVRNNFDGMVAKGLQTSRSLFTNTIQRTEKWLETVQYKTNTTHYQNTNTTFVRSVGESSLEDNLALSQASSNLSDKLFAQFLLVRLK